MPVLSDFKAVGEDRPSISVLPPWVESPYRLISWLEMEKFAAEEYCNICSNLAGMAGDFSKFAHIPGPQLLQLAALLKGVQQNCLRIGLKVSAKQFETTVENFETHVKTGLHSVQVSQILSDLGNAISCEMETQLFLQVFNERTPYYEDDELFGSAVKAAFQSASKDIKSAGTCYACDRNTACVMHLMRVLEVGLAVLATELKVLFDRRNWENIINDIEAEIKKINGPAWGPDWKQKQQFYSGAAKDFRYFKDAWRNHAMHFREHYEAAEAKSILDHVKAFMIHLADSGLHE